MTFKPYKCFITNEPFDLIGLEKEILSKHESLRSAKLAEWEEEYAELKYVSDIAHNRLKEAKINFWDLPTTRRRKRAVMTLYIPVTTILIKHTRKARYEILERTEF